MGVSIIHVIIQIYKYHKLIYHSYYYMEYFFSGCFLFQFYSSNHILKILHLCLMLLNFLSLLQYDYYYSYCQSHFQISAYYSRRSFKDQLSNSLLFLFLSGFLNLFLLYTHVFSDINYFQILYLHIYFDYYIYIFYYYMNFITYLHFGVLSDFTTYVFILHIFYQISPILYFIKALLQNKYFYRFILIMLYLVKYSKSLAERFIICQ